MSVPRQAGLPDGVSPAVLGAPGGTLAAIVAEPAAPGATGGRPGAPAVVCLPGYTGSKEDFAPLLPLLARHGHRAIAYDQRGQYQSSGPDTEAAYRRTALARDLAGLVARIGPAHVVGHSYGGIVARAAVCDLGMRPVTLTLLGSGPDQIRGGRRSLVEAMRPILADGGLAAVWRAAEALNAEDPRHRETPVDVRAFLRERLLSSSEVGLRVMGEDLCAEPDRVAELAAAGLAILVAHGADDDAWPPAVQREMAGRLGAAYTVIPDSAHSPAVEAPEATAGALVEFWQARRDAVRGRASSAPARAARRAAALPLPARTGAGDPDDSAPPGHDGLFGPDSLTWRVHADPILWIGGLRALFLQATHPVAVAGVLRHSDFRADPWGRLMRTADYVGTVTYGTRSDVAAVGARVRRLHEGVAGVDARSGTTYRATDPALLCWVHCCEVESFATTYRRAGGALSDGELDRYYREQRRAAEVVGLDPQAVPGSAREMADYFTSMCPQLRVDRHTRRIAAAILAPPMPAWVQLVTPARPAWGAGAGLAFGLLPGWARRLYGLPGLPLTDLAASAGVRSMRAALAVAPQRLREGPHLRQAKARQAATATASG